MCIAPGPKGRGLDSICTSDTGRMALGKLKTIDESPRDRANRRLAGKLALAGKAVSPFQYVSDWTPYCDDPQKVFRATKGSLVDRKPVETLLTVPCRRCGKCLQFRQMQWRERGIVECQRAPRSWMITLTFSPVHLAGILVASRKWAARMGEHAAIDRAAYPHLQRFLKRLRKNTRRKFRYLAVFERGEETNRAHYHMLLHEVDGPVLKAQIERNWRSFSHVRLVDKASGAASYITKYTTKSLGTRPRASQRYGAV